MMKNLTNIGKLTQIRAEILKSREKEKTCITVCGGTGCHAYGCIEVAEAFKDEIKKQNLQDKVDVRITGCHGFCERGPIVVIKPDEVFYQRIQLKDVKEVISETIINNKIIDRLLYVEPKQKRKFSMSLKSPSIKDKNASFLAKMA